MRPQNMAETRQGNRGRRLDDPRRAARPATPDGQEQGDDKDVLLGPRAVKEAFAAGRQINKVVVAKGCGSADSESEIRALAREAGVPVQLVERAAIDRISAGGNHQGIAAFVAPFQYAELEELMNLGLARSRPLFLVLLDGIMDPGNLGSVIRTANAAGADGVVITARRCAQVNSAVARSSAGALEHTPVARVSNLNYAIDKLKSQGIWVAGLDMDAEQTIWEADLKGPLAVVIGSEGAGMSRLVGEKCDFMLRIPMAGEISSLNAAVSFAIVAYERVRQRGI